MRYRVKFQDFLIASDMKIADSFFDKAKGLMFSSEMDGFDGLLIKGCNSIHMFFMKYSIDVLFLDTDFKIIKIIRNLKPWRMTGMYFRATQVLELPSGILPGDIEKGDYIEVVCTN